MPWELIEEEKPKESKLKSFGKELVRHTARTAHHVGSKIAGLPGDISKLIPEKEFIGAAARAVLPTSEQILEKGYKRSEGFLKPQNKVEEFADEVISDAASLLIPGTASIKGAKAVSPVMKGIKALGQSLGANLIGTGTEQVSGSKEAGSYAKMGSLLFFTLLGGPSAKSQISKLYEKAEQLLPEETYVSSDILNRNLANLEKKVTSGRPAGNLAPSEKFAHEEIQKIRKLSDSGEVNIQQLLAQKRSLNEELQSRKLFDLNRKDQQRARSLAKPLTHFINETVEQYGKINPEFLKMFKEAETGFAAIAKSNLVSNAVDKYVKFNPVTSGLLHLFGSSIGSTAAAAAAPYQAYKIGYRITKSPSLRKIYANAVGAALRQDSVVFNKELAKLDKELQQEESKEKWEFVD